MKKIIALLTIVLFVGITTTSCNNKEVAKVYLCYVMNKFIQSSKVDNHSSCNKDDKKSQINYTSSTKVK